MKQQFKFRHADEIAGTFVILAMILLVVGVVLTGRSQGWFDGSFKLHVVFDSQDGSFGLQEGAVVQVRSTIAGRVGKIKPTQDGVMGTTLILKERFRPFITTTSVAKIKKKFGVAGDSYVEIERGSGGEEIKDGDTIACVKDEELMVSAQNMLAEIEKSLLPMFEEVQQIVTNVSSIVEKVDKGKGIAGAVVSDEELRDDLTDIVAHMEGVANDIESVVNTVSGLVSNDVSKIVGDVAVMTGQTRELLTNDVPRIMADVPAMQKEVGRILVESRRVIEGVQRHWLLRKYIKHDSDLVPLVPLAIGMTANGDIQQKLAEALVSARQADDMRAIAKNAYNLAVCKLAVGNTNAAEVLNIESRLACRAAGKSEASTCLLEAELAHLQRDFETATKLAKSAVDLVGGKDQETKTEARIMLASIYLDAGDVKAAEKEIKRAQHYSKKLDQPQYGAAIQGVRAGIALRSGKQKDAAAAFIKQADWLRKSEEFGAMATSLRQAADVYSNLNLQDQAAEYYYRAASSLQARGQQTRAGQILDLAEKAAQTADNKLLLKRISQLKTTMHPKD